MVTTKYYRNLQSFRTSKVKVKSDGLKFTLAVWHAAGDAYLPRLYAYLHITLTARQASVTGRSRIRVLCCAAKRWLKRFLCFY